MTWKLHIYVHCALALWMYVLRNFPFMEIIEQSIQFMMQTMNFFVQKFVINIKIYLNTKFRMTLNSAQSIFQINYHL
jgi:hypothetical protein